MNEQELQSEVLSADDAKLREMCGSLKRVNAPKNFDMRVKARIATHNPQAQRKPFFGFLKVAAPLALAMAFLGAIVSYNIFSVNENLSSQIAASDVRIQKPQMDFPLESGNVETFVAKNSGPNANAESGAPKTVNVNLDNAVAMNDRNSLGKVLEKPQINPANTNSGGSLDRAVTLPKTFGANSTVEKPNASPSVKPYSVQEMLGFIGIKSTFSGSGWKVQSVGQNTIAERSGIKPNDVIEAVNNVRLSPDTIQLNLISGTKISLMREGIRKEITLK